MSKESTTKPPDDLEAVRSITETLKQFNADDQERVIRWAKEKLGLQVTSLTSSQERTSKEDTSHAPLHPKKHASDIKTFVTEKNPTSAIHFAATVAYYYRFEAPEAERKDSITGKDLQEACRKVDHKRLKSPIKTLHNAYRDGLLDKTGERGSFAINTVGENLVAMTLSGGGTQKPSQRKRTAKKKVTQGSGKKKAL